jgi:hypothetical protein
MLHKLQLTRKYENIHKTATEYVNYQNDNMCVAAAVAAFFSPKKSYVCISSDRHTVREEKRIEKS